jgi:hypothetical protein
MDQVSGEGVPNVHDIKTAPQTAPDLEPAS